MDLITTINREFVIRYRFTGDFFELRDYYNENCKIGLNLLAHEVVSYSKPTYLIGAGQYWKLVGLDLVDKHFKKAPNSKNKEIVFKLRRGVKITFIHR